MDVVLPDFIDNVYKTLSQSLKDEIKPGSKISIAAAFFPFMLIKNFRTN